MGMVWGHSVDSTRPASLFRWGGSFREYDTTNMTPLADRALKVGQSAPLTKGAWFRQGGLHRK
jgi:hypothetical protein